LGTTEEIDIFIIQDDVLCINWRRERELVGIWTREEVRDIPLGISGNKAD
jgi:hypothetical protein